ncbi:response regulator transcription factor [Parahaliea sp. F7430]|uniref:Response regulator transcription factor n=1 Tax=Sediminihaliea albiluteola TaxID=2758564 RepID=A0A7W2YJU0_9GAMM|nr:response regulator transcription factor [Sediminihaliea albiluteola]MBA6413510.1 response regulator transcription factor [Sediminihaliea albiluteola]
MRILLVEDDQQLGESLEAALRLEGYAVDWLDSGEAVRAALGATPYDLLLLDLGLPGVPGMQVLRQLRADKHSLPVMILTARRTLGDKVDGLDAGADDYLTKPFEMDELFARLRSLLRREGSHKSKELEAAGIVLDPVLRTVSFGGEALSLTAREFAILEILMRNAGRFVSRARLEEGIYSWGEEVGSNTIEVYVSRLRKYFGSDCIETMRGVGYRMLR